MTDITLLQGELLRSDLLYPESENSESENSIFFYDDISLSNLTPGESITIRLESQDFTPYIEFRDSDNLEDIIKSRTNETVTQLQFFAEANIDYVLRITSDEERGKGAYTITTTSGHLTPLAPYQGEAVSQHGAHGWEGVTENSDEPLILTYSFMEAVPNYYNPKRNGTWDQGDSGDFEPMSTKQQKAVRLALESWAEVANIIFEEVADKRSVKLRFGTAADFTDEATGWAYYPENKDPIGGDVWLNNQDNENNRLKPGTFGFSTLVHEIGHALGLSHPFDEAITLPQDQQNLQYTVMAYDDHPSVPSRFQPPGPMLYDVLAVEEIYGLNPTTEEGDSQYRWKRNRIILETIYDVGGEDTIKANNQRKGNIINLQPGSFSSIGNIRNRKLKDNVAIAFGTTIEHAIGGKGADTLTGNDVANRLKGKGGDDILTGLGGDDTLIGGPGNNTFVFESVNHGTDAITDFFPGFDTIDVTVLLAEGNYTGTNPFDDGVLAASVQAGSMVLEYNPDGLGATTIAIVSNVTDIEAFQNSVQIA